jgi:hypothetical protein
MKTKTTTMLTTDHSIRPRLLTRAEAAKYCNLSPQGFSDWIRSGRLPKAITGTTRWDIKAIDAAIDVASGLSTTGATAALDQWKLRHARSS